MTSQKELTWWQQAVFYQIYPRSFADGNGDGIGDFQGIISRLDYLQSLGVGALWLSPHFPSPNVDLGYDVSDYAGVAPEYGTLDDFKRFLAGAHARGMRVVLDLVLNHTSDQHPWFTESRSSRDNPRRDWYVWHDPAPDGGPPNNWMSAFGGPAWTLDPATGQYYYHFFFKEQPDLNWRNPAVKQALWDAVRFWLDLGVDGYRLDAIGTIFEDPAYLPHQSRLTETEMLQAWRVSLTPEQQQEINIEFAKMFGYQFQQPGVHELMKELRAVMDEYAGDRVLIGEDDNVAFYGNGDDELHLVFNFPLMRTDRLTPAHVRANQDERLGSMPAGAWPCNTLGNHDSTRMRSAFGDGRHDEALARLHTAMLLTLRGTPVLYNGEEIGMTDMLVTAFDQLRDNQAVNMYRAVLAEGAPADEALQRAAQMSRDRCRSPLQWADAPNAGFCPEGVAPWLPVNADVAQGINVAEQDADAASMLNFYRRLLHMRRGTPALVAGDFAFVGEASDAWLAYTRAGAGQACLIVLNFSDTPQTAPLGLQGQARCLFSSAGREGQVEAASQLALAPFEIYIGEMMA
jgi:alpha-glucosidase